MPDEFGGVEVDQPTQDKFGGIAVEEPQPSIVKSSIARAAADRFGAGPGPSGPAPKFSESLFGISPEMIPSGANTRVPALTIPLSVAGKTAAGLAGYATSPQGLAEITAAATPAAPAVMAKWAYDMVRGGYDNVKGIVQEVGGMARDALNKGIIQAWQLGPVPEGQTLQDHIQSLSEKAANAALMGAGALGVASHIKLPTREVKTVPEPNAAPLEIPPAPKLSGEAREFQLLRENWLPTIKPWRRELLDEEVAKGKGTSLNNIETNFGDSPGARDVERAKRYYELARKLFGREQASPSGVTGETTPTAPAASEAKVAEEAPSATEPAKVEATPIRKTTQEPTVTPPVTEPIMTPSGPQMGAAGITEIPETGAGGEKYGVAERVRAERAQAGQVEPVEPGQGISTQKTIEMGRDIVRRDPEAGPRIMEAFENDPKKATSTEGRAVVRAHGESLAAGARTIEETYGTESPEYRAAKEYLSDWDRRSKAMDTEFHKQGMAMQGETDIDTGSFTGLQRARQQATDGKDIPGSEVPRAKRIAKENKQAQNDVNVASNAIKSYLRKRNPVDAEKSALQAVHTRHQELAAELAKAENKLRVAEEVRQQSETQVQEDAAQSAKEAANKVRASNAVRKARQETKDRVAKAQRDKEIANIQIKNAQKALDSAKKVEEQVRNRAIKEAQRRANDPSIAVWEQANKYLDENKGLYTFDDIVNKVAVDVKMPVSKVRNIIAQDSTAKRLSSDLLLKQARARRLKEQAKIWLRELDTPGYQKALTSVPNFLFSLSVFGHGFVALGTHAPIVAFQPRFWGAYVRNFGKMYKMVFSPAYYEAQMQDLVRRSHQEEIRGRTVTVNDWELAREAGVQNDPFKYEEFHTTAIRDLVKNWIGDKNMDRVDKFASAGNRGYGVLKLLRQDMWEQRYNNLPQELRAQPEVLKGIADGINHATGVTQKQGFKGANLIFFAPRLEASRVSWLLTDPARAANAIANWKKATPAQKQFAVEQMKEKAWVFGTFASLLAMNQGFLSATGSKQKINGIPEFMGGAGIDPLAGDFMKFKVAGEDIAYGGALLTMAKLPARVATAILYEGKGSKYVLEGERVDKVIGGYIRSQLAPGAGLGVDLALGRDYEDRPLPAKMFGTVEQTGAVPKRLQNLGVDEPYSWPEFTTTKLPIPIADGIREGLRGAGMDDTQAKFWMKQMAITSILQTMTGTRITEDTREE